jgi:hypothetical protein
VNKALEWVRRHRTGVAAAVAAFVVWRVARLAFGTAWFLAGWDDIVGVGEWTLERWPLALAALAAIFVVVFLAVRALIPWIERRQSARRNSSAVGGSGG